MAMKILVVGATGVLGRNVIPRLLDRGHQVRAVVRRDDYAQCLREMGVESVIGDILDAKSLEGVARGSHVALHLATSVPKNGNQDWSMSDRIWQEGTRNLLDVLLKHGIKHYIQQSTTLIYGEQGGEIVDETAQLQPTLLSQSALEMENMVRSSGLEWIILRGGLFYGPGTGREEGWWESAQQGRLQIPGEGSDLMSLIHVVDMARAVVAAIENAPSPTGKIYNIVDDEPVKVWDLFRYVAAQAGAPAPQAGGPKYLPSLGVRNVRAQIELAWRPVYPNYRIGLAYRPFGMAIDNGIQVAMPQRTERVQTETIL